MRRPAGLSVSFVLLILVGSYTKSFAVDRTIYNRVGEDLQVTLTPEDNNGPPRHSPVLKNNEKWKVPLDGKRFRISIQYKNGEEKKESAIEFSDPRKTVANLVRDRREVSTTVPVLNPATGKVGYQVKKSYIDRFNVVFGAEGDDQNGLRFGIGFIINSGQVVVSEVYPNMPASRCRDKANPVLALNEGDRITTVNGQIVSTTESMLEAVSRSPREMRFTVVDGKTNQLFSLETTLAW